MTIINTKELTFLVCATLTYDALQYAYNNNGETFPLNSNARWHATEIYKQLLASGDYEEVYHLTNLKDSSKTVTLNKGDICFLL